MEPGHCPSPVPGMSQGVGEKGGALSPPVSPLTPAVSSDPRLRRERSRTRRSSPYPGSARLRVETAQRISGRWPIACGGLKLTWIEALGEIPDLPIQR